jgi:hypothetical protein
MNYIFHKLSGNTKHVQFQLRMSPWYILFKTGIKFIFPVFFEELLHAVVKNAQGLKDRMLRKKFVLPIESWFFTLFFGSWFCMMSPSM